MMSRIERTLQLLRDLTFTRLAGDAFQRGLVDRELDRSDAEGGYERGLSPDLHPHYYLSRRRRRGE